MNSYSGRRARCAFLFLICLVALYISDLYADPVEEKLKTILEKDNKLREDKKTEERLPLLQEGLQITVNEKRKEFAFKFSVRLGQIYLTKKEYSKAEEYLKSAIAADPNPPEAHAFLGRVYYLQNMWEEAEREFKLGLAFEPLRPISFRQLAEIAILTSRWNESLGYLQEWEKLDPQNETLYRLRGSALTGQKKWEEAETAFQQSLKIKPSARAYLDYGWLRFRQERDKEALDLMLEAEKLDPEDPEIQWRIGTVLHFSGDAREAEKRFIRSITTSPTPEAYHQYVLFLSSQKERVTDSLEAFEKLLELGGKPTADMFARYGNQLHDQNRTDDAIDAFQKALAMDRENIAAINGLANLHFQQEQFDEVAPLVEKAIKIKTAKGENAKREIGLIAVTYDVLGRYEEGAKLLKEAIDAGKNGSDPLLEFIGQLGLADLNSKQGLHKTSIQNAEKAVSALRKSEEYKELLISGQLSIASEAISLRDFTLAEKYLEEALKSIERLDSKDLDERWILFYQTQSELLEARDNIAGAIDSTKKALDIARKNDFRDSEMESLKNLNYLYRRTGDFALSSQKFQEFLTLLDQVKGDSVKNKYLGMAAAIFAGMGDYEKALEYNAKTLELSSVQKIPLRASAALRARGSLLSRLGKYEEALRSYEEALSRIQGSPIPREIAACKEGLSGIYATIGDYRRARESLEEAKKIYGEIKRKDLLVNTLVSIGDLDYNLGDSQKAFKAYQQAAKMYGEMESWLDVTAQYYRMGIMKEEQKQYPEALQLFQRGFAVSQEKKDIRYTIYFKEGIGRQQMFLEQFEQAEKQFQESMQLLDDGGATVTNLKRDLSASMGEFFVLQQKFKEAEESLLSSVEPEMKAVYPTHWKAWYLLGLAQRGLGKTDQAIESIKKSVEIIERMREATVGTPQDRNFRGRYREIYKALIDLLLQQGNLDDSYYYMELQKIAELKDSRIGLERFRAQENDPTLATARQYRFNLIDIERQLLEEQQKNDAHRDQDRIDNLNALRENMEKAHNDHLKKHPELKSKLKDTPQQLGSIMQSMPQGVVLIQPIILPDRIEVLIYTHTGRVPGKPHRESEKTVLKQLKNLESALRDGTTEEVKENAAPLYEWLIRPLENQLENATLLVVAAYGSLRNIPFQSLYDKNRNQFLVEKIPIVNLATVKMDYPDLRKENIRILAIANPTGADLNDAEAQARRVGKIFPTQILTGEKATLENLKWDKTKEKYNVLMFATHAELNVLDLENSHIRLAQDIRLKYEDIPSYRPYWQDEIRMAVLSACETAAAADIEDSMMSNLAGQFDLIGIHSIVASLWRVNAASTSDLVVNFFENLKKNLSLADSLQQAQLKLLRDQKEPYHWAPFILLGDWR